MATVEQASDRVCGIVARLASVVAVGKTETVRFGSRAPAVGDQDFRDPTFEVSAPVGRPGRDVSDLCRRRRRVNPRLVEKLGNNDGVVLQIPRRLIEMLGQFARLLRIETDIRHLAQTSIDEPI